MELPVFKKRYGNEYLGLTEFITPHNPKVCDVLRDEIIISSDVDAVWALWDWCCRNIIYPPTGSGHEDYHKQEKFLANWPVAFTSLKRSVNDYDFWQFPFETLDPPRYGDCEDRSSVLASFLLNILPRGSVFAVIGRIFGLGHAWVEIKEGGKYYIIDPTLPKACDCGLYGQESVSPYEPLIRFDDLDVYEAFPGYEYYLNISTEAAKINYKSKYDMLLEYYKGRI